VGHDGLTARYPGQIRQISAIFFIDLPAEIQADVAVCLKSRLERIHNISDAEAIWRTMSRIFLRRSTRSFPFF